MRMCQTKVYEELRAILGKHTQATLQDMEKLTYLKAVLAEVYRFAPTVPLALLHGVDGDAEVFVEVSENEKVKLHKDTILVVNIWAAHRDKEKFGADADRFRPERFLLAGGNDVDQRLIDETIPFGVGKRRCPGENLARQEVFIFVAAVLQRYSVQLGPNSAKKAEELLNSADGGFFLKPKPHELIFSRRNNN